MTELAEVRVWDRRLGAVHQADERTPASFEYDADFAASDLEVAPLRMPLRANVPYSFPDLVRTSFDGLPGLLADALPDRWGNALIDAWLARQGRSPSEFSPVERLCYVGSRAMGALEFRPAIGPDPTTDERIEVEALAGLAADVLSERATLRANVSKGASTAGIEEILRVGSSAGGARAKALVAYEPSSGEVRSGQLNLKEGYEYWLLKFDGIGDATRELGDSTGYGAVEMAYSRLAQEAGIEMTECRLLEEGGRRHFMTRRFDRTASGERLHMQTLAALLHLDYELPSAHSYEQALLAARELGLGAESREQLFRRAAFNVVARNQDDHVKNIAFLMDPDGRWSLAPAYDLTYAYNPDGRWTSAHQMSINGRRADFSVEDLAELASVATLPSGRGRAILSEVIGAVSRWPEVAADLEIDPGRIDQIAATHRLQI